MLLQALRFLIASIAASETWPAGLVDGNASTVSDYMVSPDAPALTCWQCCYMYLVMMLQHSHACLLLHVS